MEHLFERKSLFDEVWSAPLLTLAKKYGLSDNGLRKICKAMNIPLPVAGHWSKVAAGRAPLRPTLPEEAQRTTFRSNPRGPLDNLAEFSSQSDEDWLSARLDEEVERTPVVQWEPRRWHPAINPVRDELTGHARKYESAVIARERAKIQPKRGAGFDYPYWDIRHNEIILGGVNRASAIRVSAAGLQRALAIVNAILLEAEARGFEARLEIKAARFTLRALDTDVQFYLSEQLSASSRGQQKTGTGKMRMVVGHSYSAKTIDEPVDGSIELQLRNFFFLVYRLVVKGKRNKRQVRARDRAEDEERKQRASREAERARQEAAALEEAERRRCLVQQVEQWELSRRIKAFIAHQQHVHGLRSGNVAEESVAFDQWVAWALRVADDIDPSIS